MEWYILVLASAILMGVAEVFRKKALSKEHSMQFTTIFFTALFLLSFFFIGKVNFSINYHQLGLIALKSFLVLGALIMMFRTLKHTDISKTAPLKNLNIIFIVILSIIFLNEKISLISFVGLSFVLVGTYLVEINPKVKHHFHPLTIFKNKYSIYMLIYLIGISIVALLDKIILKTTGIYTYTFFTLMFATIFAWLIQFILYDGMSDIKSAIKQGKNWIIPAAIIGLFSDLLYFSALAMPTVYLSLAIPLRMSSSMVATFFGGRMFHEKNIIPRIVGCFTMIIGIYLIVS